MIDLEELTKLQQALLRESLANVPLEVTKYAIAAADGGGSMTVKVDAPVSFALSDEAVAALRGIFLVYEAAGHPLRSLRSDMAENADETWSMSMEFEYV